MAVKNNVAEVHEEAAMVEHIFDHLEATEPDLDTIDKAISACEDLINQLVYIKIPSNAVAIKEYKISIGKVGAIFERIAKRHGDFEKVFVHCLQTLYNRIVYMNEPKASAASAIIFNVYDEHVIPKAIESFLPNIQSPEADQDVKKVISTLCFWLRSSSGFLHLGRCIIDLLEGLRKMQKYDLLIDIANNITEPLFIALIIPFIRHYVMPVVYYILTSIQNDSTIFHKILPRIPKVLAQIEKSIGNTHNADPDTSENLQRLVDLMYALKQHYPVMDDRYRELDDVLNNYTISFGNQDLLNVMPWHCVTHIQPREQGLPLGLNNLGNTCYMNSVIQALFLTRQFLTEIIDLEINSTNIRAVRELMALLLGSHRSQLSPTQALQTRPLNFRHGYQHDSFEYLGHLLDQLYEEEKRHIVNLVKNEPFYNNAWNTETGNDILNLDGGGNNFLMNCEQDKKNLFDMDFPNQFDNNNFDVDVDAGSLNATFDVNPLAEELVVEPTLDIYGNSLMKDDNFPDYQMQSVPPTPSPTTPSPISANVSGMSIASNTSNATHISPLSNSSITSTVVTNTLVQKVFSGQSVITLKCLNCSTESHNKDSFYDLQLTFPDRCDGTYEIEHTVQDLLNAYFETEQLDGENQYSCGNCNTHCDGERSIKIADGPANLILVIKHFRYNRHTHVRKKIMQKISYDRTVELKVVDENGEKWNNVYRLYAVIVHYGTNVDSGHYFTLALDAAGNWFNFNDSHISRTNLEEISRMNKLNSPYVYFYELVSKNRLEEMCIESVAEVPSNTVETPYSTPPDYPSEDDQPEPSYYDNKFQTLSQSNVRFQYSHSITVDNLPLKLKEFVEQDNALYKQELSRPAISTYMRNYNVYKKPDNDRDPPSTCGQGPALITNPFTC